jgi:hypothetical protein
MLKVNVNSYLQEQFTRNLGSLVKEVEGLGGETQVKFAQEEVLAGLREQKEGVVTMLEEYTRRYIQLKQELLKGNIIENSYILKRSIEILKVLSRKTKSRLYLKYKNFKS